MPAQGSRVDRVESVELYGVEREFLAALAPHLARRMAFTLSVAEQQFYLTTDGVQLTTALTRHPLGENRSS